MAALAHVVCSAPPVSRSSCVCVGAWLMQRVWRSPAQPRSQASLYQLHRLLACWLAAALAERWALVWRGGAWRGGVAGRGGVVGRGGAGQAALCVAASAPPARSMHPLSMCVLAVSSRLAPSRRHATSRRHASPLLQTADDAPLPAPGELPLPADDAGRLLVTGSRRRATW